MTGLAIANPFNVSPVEVDPLNTLFLGHPLNPLFLGYMKRVLTELRWRLGPRRTNPSLLAVTGLEPEDRWLEGKKAENVFRQRQARLETVRATFAVIDGTLSSQTSGSGAGEEKYGRCIGCGEKISPERFFASGVFPCGVRCCSCQREHESRKGANKQ